MQQKRIPILRAQARECLEGSAAMPADTVQFLGQTLRARPAGPAQTPTLFVVVDTEAEFDWFKPFARDMVKVRAMAAQQRAQAILDRYGIRPVYVIDYPVASQPEGYMPLQAILARGACEIGAHLHPWTNPPFDEPLGVVNSYPGNLPAGLEEAKFAVLLEAIQASFGLQPRFYKAGRYGIGPGTLAMLTRHGVGVDFSILPGADMRAVGGPDFRALCPIPYETPDGRLTVMPMTRGHSGLLAAHDTALNAWLVGRIAQRLRLRGIFSRLGVLDRITLTPEGTSAGRLVALLASLHRRGCREFVMTWHSPSLVPGNTPYVRTEADLTGFLARIETVCRYVVESLGGRAGDPLALLPDQFRPVRNAS